MMVIEVCVNPQWKSNGLTEIVHLSEFETFYEEIIGIVFYGEPELLFHQILLHPVWMYKWIKCRFSFDLSKMFMYI